MLDIKCIQPRKRTAYGPWSKESVTDSVGHELELLFNISLLLGDLFI